MSEEAARQNPRRWIKWTLRVIGYGFAALCILTLLPIDIPFEFVGLLLFGWVPYLWNVLPRAVFDPEIALEAMFVLMMAVFGLHRVLRWWARNRNDSDAQWRVNWTIKIAMGVLLLFATSIAATGIVHQIGWLFRAEELTYDASRGAMTKELIRLKQVVTGLKLFTDDHEGKFPADLDELIPEYLETRDLFYSSLSPMEPPERILYFPFDGKSLPGEWIVVAGPQQGNRPGRAAKRTVAHGDGTALVIHESEFQKRLAVQGSGSK